MKFELLKFVPYSDKIKKGKRLVLTLRDIQSENKPISLLDGLFVSFDQVFQKGLFPVENLKDFQKFYRGRFLPFDEKLEILDAVGEIHLYGYEEDTSAFILSDEGRKRCSLPISNLKGILLSFSHIPFNEKEILKINDSGESFPKNYRGRFLDFN